MCIHSRFIMYTLSFCSDFSKGQLLTHSLIVYMFCSYNHNTLLFDFKINVLIPEHMKSAITVNTFK